MTQAIQCMCDKISFNIRTFARSRRFLKMKFHLFGKTRKEGDRIHKQTICGCVHISRAPATSQPATTQSLCIADSIIRLHAACVRVQNRERERKTEKKK